MQIQLILNLVKTSVTIPAALVRRAERAARKMGVSRSQLFAIAIAGFLKRITTENTTKSLNEVYAQESSKLDLFLELVQTKSLIKEKW